MWVVSRGLRDQGVVAERVFVAVGSQLSGFHSHKAMWKDIVLEIFFRLLLTPGSPNCESSY